MGPNGAQPCTATQGPKGLVAQPSNGQFLVVALDLDDENWSRRARADAPLTRAAWATNKQSNESGGAASEKAKEAKGQIILCNPKKNIAAAARANTKSREVAAANKYSRTAAARPTNGEAAETLVSEEACSGAVVGLIAPKRPKGP
jgi:hypothetical protein